MAVVQTTWRKSYEQMVDWVATNEGVALALGFTLCRPDGKMRTISKSQTGKGERLLYVVVTLSRSPIACFIARMS